MLTTVRVLNVFLASPSDVTPEREAAEEVVNQLNKSLAQRSNWHIRLHRWEDVSPGAGRPQELINPAVDGCNLFIGLLWEHWGLPTGSYSSGFEEEYERALARRKQTHEPQLWLVFKKADAAKLKDPGPQLAKVLEFRKNQIALREVLFKDVSDFEDWKSKLTFWLFEHVLFLVASETKNDQSPPVSAPEPESLETSSNQQVNSAAEDQETSVQLLEITNSLMRVIKSGRLEFSRQDAKHLQEFDIARLFLFSATLMSWRSTGETLRTHEMNLLYKYRQRLELTAPEYRELYRTVVIGTSESIPGWYWFRGWTPDTVRDNFLFLTAHDSSARVRGRALDFLIEARIKVPEDLWPVLPFADSDESLQTKAYTYLGLLGDESSLPFLEEPLSDEKEATVRAVRNARLTILTRLKPAQAILELIDDGKYVSDDKLLTLENSVANVPDEVLLKGMESEGNEMREFSVRGLASRGKLTKPLAEKLTADSSVRIREIAFSEIARQGYRLDFQKVRQALQTSDDGKNSLWALGAALSGRKEPNVSPNSVILAFYQTRPTEELLEIVNWFSVNGATAYKSLAVNRFETVSKQLRQDLEDGFIRVKQESIERLERQLGQEQAVGIVDSFREVDSYIRSRFVEAALNGLLANGEAADIRYGKQYLADTDHAVKLAATRILCKFGGPDDLPVLLQISTDAWGEMRDEAGAAALRLSPRPFETALELLKNRSAMLVQMGFNWLYQQDSPEVRKFFEELADDKDDTNRVRSVYYFSRKLETADLETLLETQFKKETYYYNVIFWLDRLVYAPSPLRELFAAELKKKAN